MEHIRNVLTFKKLNSMEMQKIFCKSRGKNFSKNFYKKFKKMLDRKIFSDIINKIKNETRNKNFWKFDF